MPIILGVDLGTTTITALALDTAAGEIAALQTLPNRAETTAPADRARGYSEWDVRQIATTACECLRVVIEEVGPRRAGLAGLGITGQQHGVVLVDAALAPLTPLVNWQDRRGEQRFPGSDRTFVQEAVARTGPDAPRRAGCRLHAGYLAVTLFWMKQHGRLPATATACFVMDYFGALLTGQSPVTDPTCAASSGVLDVAAGDWDGGLLGALDLPRSLFPPVRPSGDHLGRIISAMAGATGLPAGLPVFVGIGDNQASFLGSVADREQSVLVNVGTGGQVAAWTPRLAFDPLLETRPFPRGGFLLVSAGLCGGASYAALERFFRAVGEQLFGATATEPLFTVMNRLAADVPLGADGLRCEPFFSGTRARPELRASWSGASMQNFTPAHLTRALLEGMANAFRSGYEQIVRQTGSGRQFLVGAGNGLRENAVLADAVADATGLPVAFPRHREEAAFGAALLAAVGAGVFPDLAAAGRLVCYK